MQEVMEQTWVAVPISSGTIDPGSIRIFSNSVLLYLKLSISSTGHWRILVPVLLSNSTALGMVYKTPKIIINKITYTVLSKALDTQITYYYIIIYYYKLFM